MTTKDIIIQSLSTPDRMGYNDKINIVIDDTQNGFHCPCSACPNPFKIVKPGKPDIDGSIAVIEKHYPWRQVYGWIACNDKEYPYTWQCITSPKHGKCLLLNGGGELPARYPNSKHDGRLVVSAVEIHCGETKNWRGSAACITLPPFIWQGFIGYFQLNETGNLYVLDYTNMEQKL